LPTETCERASIDISNSFLERYLSTFELKVPSEHTIKGKQYDAEMQFSFVDNVPLDSLENRDDDIAMTSILLKADQEKNNKWLEDLLLEWEETARKTVKACPYWERIEGGTLLDDGTYLVGSIKDGEYVETIYVNGTYAKRTDSYWIKSDTHPPTDAPTFYPTFHPTITSVPTKEPTQFPTISPTGNPTFTRSPTFYPTVLIPKIQTRRQLQKKKKSKIFIHSPLNKKYFYGYKGSLTIPPCSENVNWYIIDEPLSISTSQLSRIQYLTWNYLNKDCNFGTYAGKEGNVNRPIQEYKTDIFNCDENDYKN